MSVWSCAESLTAKPLVCACCLSRSGMWWFLYFNRLCSTHTVLMRLGQLKQDKWDKLWHEHISRVQTNWCVSWHYWARIIPCPPPTLSNTSTSKCAWERERERGREREIKELECVKYRRFVCSLFSGSQHLHWCSQIKMLPHNHIWLSARHHP